MASEAQVLEITELRLGLPGRCREVRAKKRALSGIDDEEELVHGGLKSDGGSCYVKVSFDGAPFLRKLNLSAYEGYEHLEGAIDGLFEHLKIDCREYIHVYEDREGDWMLVGDVPWEMFVQSCKKLRVMKGSEANAFKTHARSLRNHVQE